MALKYIGCNLTKNGTVKNKQICRDTLNPQQEYQLQRMELKPGLQQQIKLLKMF